MTGRFERLKQSVKRKAPQAAFKGPQNAVKRAAPALALKRLSPEERAAGLAAGAVLAGAVGLAVFSPLGGANASTEDLAATVNVKHAAAVSQTSEKSASTMSLAEAREQGWKVQPQAVEASEVIDLAKEQVGIKEEGPGNMTKFHEWYVSTPHAESTAARDGGFSTAAYNGAPWCDMFVSWLGSQTGVKGMGWDAYTVQHANWFKDTGRWGTEPKPGALAFYDWGNGSNGDIGAIDHVGLVVEDNGDGTITSIGGNVDNEVKQKIRDKGQVVGYGYPDYAA